MTSFRVAWGRATEASFTFNRKVNVGSESKDDLVFSHIHRVLQFRLRKKSPGLVMYLGHLPDRGPDCSFWKMMSLKPISLHASLNDSERYM